MTDGTDVAVADDGAATARDRRRAGRRPVEEHGATPTPRQYVMIAVVLVILTARRGRDVVPRRPRQHELLIIIARRRWRRRSSSSSPAWYMHMKQDPPFFRRIFIVGIVGASHRLRHRVRRVLEHGAEVVGRRVLGDVPFPAWQPHPDVWLLDRARSAVGYALAITRLGPRLAPDGHAGRHALPDRLVLGRPARAVGRVRLADPRPRRALPLLGAHGAAHRRTRSSPRRCC